MLGLLQLSCSSSHKNSTGEVLKSCSQKGDPVEVPKFCLDDIKGLVCTTQKVIILPFHTINVCASTSVKGHCMHGTNARSPVASSNGAHSDLWGIASWVLEGTHLLAQLEHPDHGNACKSCGWTGYSCQPSTTGGPPNQDYCRDNY